MATPENSEPGPSCQHPLLQPDKWHIPPPLARAQHQPKIELKRPPTTFDEILTVNISSQPHGKQPASHIDLPTTLHRHSTPPLAHAPAKTASRTARFFAHFRSSSSSSARTTAERELPRQSRSRFRSGNLEPQPQPQPDRQPQSQSLDRRARRQQSRECHQQSRERRECAKRENAELKEAQQQERARNQWLGGVAWGFDPDAGLRRASESQSQIEGQVDLRRNGERGSCSTANGVGSPRGSAYESASRVPRTSGPSRRTNYERTTSSGGSSSRGAGSASTSPRQAGIHHLGVETGGPGREGQYKYGMLKSRQVQIQMQSATAAGGGGGPGATDALSTSAGSAISSSGQQRPGLSVRKC